MTEEVAALTRTLGASDQGKLTEYLDAVRDVERRIQTAERQSDAGAAGGGAADGDSGDVRRARAS